MINSIILPKGLRIEVVDNDNLTVPVGTKATVGFDEEVDVRSWSHLVFVTIDGQKTSSALPFNQCKIIVEGESK